jgi:anti-anti-sigma factor
MDIRVTTSPVGDALVVSLTGIADVSALPTLRSRLDRIMGQESADRVVVDLDGLSLVDDTTLGLLLGAAARVRSRGGDFSVVCTNERMSEHLHSTGFDRAVPVASSIVEATAGTTTGAATTTTTTTPTTALEPTAVIFTNRLRVGDRERIAAYDAAAARMEELAARQPGYLGIESVRGDDGVGITVSYWESADAAAGWKRDAEHLAAQHDGREHWYEWYRVRVATIDREYSYDRDHVSANDDTD